MTSEYLSVSTLTRYLKQKFDRDPYLGQVYLTGEISNLRIRPNSHQYFSLKDDGAKISAVMFKGAFNKLKFRPEEGQKVLVIGRVSLYEASGNYQIYIEHMEPDGVGALYQALKELQQKLAQEGLFQGPKKPLVRFPKKIAVVTSPSGAVIRDIITTVKRRYPIAEITLFPTLVQGEQAAANIVKNIQAADALDFDTLIIGRGGGSIEDLWPFNEEKVARAIFAAKTPIISSVGHETDTTIADLVADVRAATPTAAAELAVPVLVEELARLQDYQQRLARSLQKTLQQKRQQVETLQGSYIFQQPRRLYDALEMKVDLLQQQLQQNYQRTLQQRKEIFSRLAQSLQQQNPTARLAKEQVYVEQLGKDLARLVLENVKDKRQRFTSLVTNLDLLSPLNILGRGFSYVTVADQIVKSVTQVDIKQEVVVHLHEGKFTAQVVEKEEIHE